MRLFYKQVARTNKKTEDLGTDRIHINGKTFSSKQIKKHTHYTLRGYSGKGYILINKQEMLIVG